MLALQDRLAEVRARREEGEKGFTLIELLVVVIIIGILAAIAIPIFLGQQDQARGSAAQSAVTNAKTALVSYLVADGSLSAAEATAVEGEYTTSTAAGNGITVDVQLAASGNGFCIQATHNEIATNNVWSTTDDSGVRNAAC